MSGIASGPDPLPWRHVDGDRVSDPAAEGAPVGGFTYDPRPGCSDCNYNRPEAGDLLLEALKLETP
ncbi:hypothetical protein [Rhodococcus erythropolis]|uniref:hypothetical protein n=1 Tax=Rhodococcus erythropolis TaxID=1833 RepID=UPI001BE6F24C|nr:hypothetical protein [Rhodococcus erythropolis]MBT2266414.1 hypothetical protein [Rhodococcus erythropolis]